MNKAIITLTCCIISFLANAQAQTNSRVVDNPDIQTTNFPIDFIKKASIDRKSHYQFSTIEISELKNIEPAFFKKWLQNIPANTSYGIERLGVSPPDYLFFDFKELKDKILFTIISNDESSYHTIIHYTFDKRKAKIVQVFKSGITENDEPLQHTFLDYNKAGDILKQAVLSRENDTIVIEKFEFNLNETKYTKIDVSSKLSGTFKDSRDGHTYKTITIGTQTWMAENLAFKSDSGCWVQNNDENNVAIYGRLYNWETAKKVCPAGWHLPSDLELTTLTNYLGGKEIAGEKMKTTSYWKYDPNGIATNESGFSALPAGYYNYKDGSYGGIGISSDFWSSTPAESEEAMTRSLRCNNDVCNRFYSINQNMGYSVRCIKD